MVQLVTGTVELETLAYQLVAFVPPPCQKMFPDATAATVKVAVVPVTVRVSFKPVARVPVLAGERMSEEPPVMVPALISV